MPFGWSISLGDFLYVERKPVEASAPPPPPPPPSDDDLIDLDEADPDLRPRPLEQGPRWRRALSAAWSDTWDPALHPLPAPGIWHVDFWKYGISVHTFVCHVAGRLQVLVAVYRNGEALGGLHVYRRA